MRWPGTWHRKAAPRLARIVYLEPDREIDLGDALDRLETAAAAHGLMVEVMMVEVIPPASSVSAGLAEDEDDLASLAAVIPNADLDWQAWNRVGMAFWGASGGNEAGLAAFHAWSGKSGKYTAAGTDARWSAYRRSPPTRLTIGTLIHLAAQADPSWTLPSRARAMREGAVLIERLLRAHEAKKAAAALAGGRR
jgi:hypothetical protein